MGLTSGGLSGHHDHGRYCELEHGVLDILQSHKRKNRPDQNVNINLVLKRSILD